MRLCLACVGMNGGMFHPRESKQNPRLLRAVQKLLTAKPSKVVMNVLFYWIPFNWTRSWSAA